MPALRWTSPPRIQAERAQLYTWVGEGRSGDWNDPRNWHPRGVPSNGASVNICCGRVVVPDEDLELDTMTIAGGHVNLGGPNVSIETLEVYDGYVGISGYHAS